MNNFLHTLFSNMFNCYFVKLITSFVKLISSFVKLMSSFVKHNLESIYPNGWTLQSRDSEKIPYTKTLLLLYISIFERDFKVFQLIKSPLKYLQLLEKYISTFEWLSK
jgi:hypothetical protein